MANPSDLNPPILELQDVTISFGTEVILKNINLRVQHHETLVLIGPSGDGKTVLLKTMAGIIPASSGHVFVEGEDWQNLESDHKRELAKKIGVLFQKSALFDDMTCAENVAFPLKEHTTLNEAQINEKVIHYLEKVGLGQAYGKFPFELSGGMQRRLGIARALALNPEIVFYDDPTAGQDPLNSDKIIDLIVELKKENNSTLIVVTNDMKRAFQIADRVIMVVNQEVIDTGTPDQTKASADPRIQQFILGRLRGPLTHD
jgi:phospholipid/cholesterol/gamma-HCH transport system ATP-binding protein